MKTFYLLIPLFLVLSNNTFGQEIISWKKNVYYFDSKDSTYHKLLVKLTDSDIKYEGTLKRKISFLILLDISIDKEPSYELGYDNLYGTSVKSDIYKYKTWDYKTLGLRVVVYDTVINEKGVIALINYGVHHIKKLKERRNKLTKMAVEDRPRNTSISPRKIKKILDLPPS